MTAVGHSLPVSVATNVSRVSPNIAHSGPLCGFSAMNYDLRHDRVWAVFGKGQEQERQVGRTLARPSRSRAVTQMLTSVRGSR
jgi:hypothetical protein